jgi:hypothetical protein
MLREKGHTPIPVHPGLSEVAGFPVCPSLRDCRVPVDTITLYLSAPHQQAIADDILRSGARRVIFNPGAENPDLAKQLAEAGKEVQNACTLVLLTTGQF